MPVCLVSETERKHVMEVFKSCRPGSPDVRLWTISGEKCMLTGTVRPKRGKCFTRHAEWNWRWVLEGASEQAMNPGPTADGAPVKPLHPGMVKQWQSYNEWGKCDVNRLMMAIIFKVFLTSMVGKVSQSVLMCIKGCRSFWEGVDLWWRGHNSSEDINNDCPRPC